MSNSTRVRINIGLIIGIVLIIIIGAFFLTKDGEDTKEAMSTTSDTVVETTDATSQPLTSGIYTEYSEELLANAESGTVLLFFHAGWCPSCRALDKDISRNLDNLPEDMTILKLNYDTETELKKKYGVTRQHTLVQVDADGNMIKTLSGLSNTLDQVLSKI